MPLRQSPWILPTSVTALGTAFDVRYGNDDTEVTVTENAVQIESDGDRASSVRVKQGAQAIYDYARKETVVSPVDGLVALAWRRGQIAVDNAPHMLPFSTALVGSRLPPSSAAMSTPSE
jgi:ferric-dicitrate binding protein FerR (iron transport regulator)